MNYKNEEEVMKRVHEHYDWAVGAGYEVVGVFLQGSFNYERNFGDLTDEESDVDTKCLVLPTFKDFCLNKKLVSTTHILENGEHCDVKDLRLYIQNFKKQNVNFVEILFSDYVVMNPKYNKEFYPMFAHKEAVARYNEKAALDCVVGMAYQKQKALCHPYEGLKEKLEKYGYDGKQLSHCMRLKEFAEKYTNGFFYKDCLISDMPKLLLNVKRNKAFSLEEAKTLMDCMVEELQYIRNKYFKIKELVVNTELDILFEEVAVDCMMKNFKEYLKEN